MVGFITRIYHDVPSPERQIPVRRSGMGGYLTFVAAICHYVLILTSIII